MDFLKGRYARTVNNEGIDKRLILPPPFLLTYISVNIPHPKDRTGSRFLSIRYGLQSGKEIVMGIFKKSGPGTKAYNAILRSP